MIEVEKFIGLDSLPAAYEALFHAAGKRSFFLTRPWFLNFERHVGSRKETIIYVAKNSAEPRVALGALILWQKNEPILIFKSARLEALANYYTSYYSPLVAGEEVNFGELAAAFAEALWQEKRRWDVLNLFPLDPEAVVFRALLESFRAVGAAAQTYFCYGNWYLKVAGRSYAEYFQALPKILRKNIPYETRKLEKRGSVRIEVATDLESLGPALGDYERIYNASWRVPEPYPDFIRGLARLAATNGWLRLGVLYFNNEPAAAQFWIVHEGVASIYKICYQEKFASLSVGKILTARMIERAIDIDKVREIDYLSGDDDYKKEWMSHRRERWGIRVFNSRSMKGLALAVRYIGGRAVKRRWARAVAGRKSAAESLAGSPITARG